MSNRHLKRLEQQNDLKVLAVGDVEPLIEDEIAVKPAKKGIFQLVIQSIFLNLILLLRNILQKCFY